MFGIIHITILAKMTENAINTDALICNRPKSD